ncbi:MAG: winged helix-turn-helix domain-containing protein [Desulfobacter sp.]|nr:MAG: winged helix-turn-helix domain-containing protein [Desulfobacter sp.]
MDTEAKKRILLVEDDLRLASLVSTYLSRQEFEVDTEHRGDDAVQRIIGEEPDLVILDLMLPGKDGFAVCREVRQSYAGPILMLTAREEDMDQVVGLELGADDYVKKPVEPRVLLARIRALFRRAAVTQAAPDHNEIKFGGLALFAASRRVTLAGNPVELSTNEFDLLWLLASRAGEVLDRDLLYREVKGIEYDGLDRSIDVAVSRLRKKLNDSPDHPCRIKTVWGSGYLFVADAWGTSNPA